MVHLDGVLEYAIKVRCDSLLRFVYTCANLFQLWSGDRDAHCMSFVSFLEMTAWWPGISFSSSELVRIMHARYIGVRIITQSVSGVCLKLICMLKFFQNFSVQT
jgi:hypothetical protein